MSPQITRSVLLLLAVMAASGQVPHDCLKCICFVETTCNIPYPLCHMDVGSLSCGPYQIKLAYWQDARQKGGSLDGDWQNCSATYDCSERAVQGYMARYATYARLGHNPTCEDFARIHNGGPNGFKNPATEEYWLRVKKCLDKDVTPDDATKLNKPQLNNKT